MAQPAEPNEAARRAPVPLTVVPGMPGRGPGLGPPGMGPGMWGPVVRPRNLRQSAVRIWAFFGGERWRIASIFGFILLDSALGMSGPYLIGRAVDSIAAIGRWRAGCRRRARRASRTHARAPYCRRGAPRRVRGRRDAPNAGGLAHGRGIPAHGPKRAGRPFRKAPASPALILRSAHARGHDEPPYQRRGRRKRDGVAIRGAADVRRGRGPGTLAVMLALNPLLAVASLVPVPLVLLLTSTISRRTRTLFKQQQDALGALNGHVEETVSGMQAVKAFGREQKSMESFSVINQNLRQVGRAQIWTGS